MVAKALMIQGTSSHVGKSLLATAFCRIFKQDGFRVLPFKAQNMSNNAYVTKEGQEMSQAQAQQAKACGVEPSVLMNPILLKPTTDMGAQVIVLGKARETMEARAYEAFKPRLQSTVTTALKELMTSADILVIEGAGSPAEINLRDGDIVNMWIAQKAQAKVLLVGNIDWGGVFAQLVGTMELLDQKERSFVRGFIINKFRGDKTLLESGIQWLQARLGLPVLGVIPYFHDVELLEEDSIRQPAWTRRSTEDHIQIDIIHLPRMSNFTDFAPFERDPQIHLRYLNRPPADGLLPDCVILPGSKSTVADLAFVRERGLDAYLRRCVDAQRELIGICGGFQMLGEQILDPDHVEASADRTAGLGLLSMTTVFRPEKVVASVQGVHLDSKHPVFGYEIHMGRMQQESPLSAVFKFTMRGESATEEADGLQSSNGRIWGTYLHGVFDADRFRQWWIERLRKRKGLAEMFPTQGSSEEDAYDRLANAVREHLDLKALYRILELDFCKIQGENPTLVTSD